jgi:DUF438 domain-containing protein
MDKEKLMSHILDSLPYPIVFADCDHIIRYMNKAAEFHYYSQRGYSSLIGESLFDCHNETSREKIKAAFEKLKNHGNEIFIAVTVKNQRVYMNPVRDESGELMGYFERFEMNLEK